MSDYDAIVIGAGHNGLICAAYLAKAGYSVCVLERQPVVGGAVITQEIVPGYKFDLGGSIISLLNLTPIVEELDLGNYGYQPIFLDPMFFSPYPDGSHLMFWRDVDRTCQSIATISPQDAESYRRFVRDWRPFLEIVIESMHETPSPFNMAVTWGGGLLRHLPRTTKALGLISKSMSGLLKHYFISPKLQAAIAWMGIQSGTGVDEPFGAMTAAWFVTYHMKGMAHPRGGVGELTQSLARMIRAHGGIVLTNAEVAEITLSNGQVNGVRLTSGDIITARKTVSAVHIQTTLRLIAKPEVPFRKRIDNLNLGNGIGMAVRLAVHELPNYLARPGKFDSQHTALQLIAPDVQYLRQAYADYAAGKFSKDPAVVAMTFSAVDPTLAPANKHTLYLWGQYFPYTLADGRHWDAVREEAANAMLNKLFEYAPNLRTMIIDKYIETPLDIENLFGMPKANITHLPMTPARMFFMRPVPGLSQYRGPHRNLYLSGASTHPGGGIIGLPGRNAAQIILEDFSKKR